MNSLKAPEIQLSNGRTWNILTSTKCQACNTDARYTPSSTFTPVGSSIAYTWSQVRPAPTSTVPHVESTFVSLKRVITVSTPLVEENPGFVACPPHFTAKGVCLDPRIRRYENMSREKLAHQIR